MTSPYPSTTLVVVDSTVKDYQGLINSVSCDTEVVVLNAHQDGIEQITSILRNYREISSLHILSHGESGTLYLGNARLSLATLEHYTEQIQAWGKAIATHAGILLYGCRVASGTLGQNFVRQLSRLTSASIAASNNLTGNAALGGDWTLEFTTGAVNMPLAFSSEAIAAYPHVLQQVLLTETFTGEDVLENTWLFGVDNSDQGQANPFLTARATIDPSTGGLPGNPGVAPYPSVDTPGSGVLRLTNATIDQASYVLYDRPIPSSAGLLITFDFFSYGGTGADGFNFFLADGANPPTAAGGFGGSLGYAQINAAFQGDGVAGGYFGIGFDEYGNYSNPTEDRVGGIIGSGPGGRTPDAVAIRGSEANNYAYLTGTSSLPYSLDVPDAANREAARRTAQIELTPDGFLSIRIDVNGDGLFTGEGESPEELQNFNIIEANGELPDIFTFGFASGTGSFTNVHEIRNLEVLTFTDPPEVSDVTNNVPAGIVTNLTGLSATDDDGTIVSYTIETLPDATQGILYLGDPTAGGTAITAGQVLTPAQISQLFFQPVAGFTGATFTYNATDELGGQDATPGTVTLALLDVGNQPPIANDLIVDDLNPGATVLIPPLDATDPDGSIASYTIVRLPETSQGVLYLGDPAAGGTPIAAGTVLSPGQVDQLYLQINPNFTGGVFTFYATDNQGAVSNVATITLDDETIVDPVNPGCEPGIRRRGNDNDNNLQGTSGIDTLRGGGGNDTLNGLGCPDLLEGNGGRDEIFGGNGSDTIRGGLGNDVLSGQNGNDIINGGLGDDTINGGNGNDRIQGRRGEDLINGRAGDDFIVGNDGNDVLAGGANNDVVRGLNGDDRINGNTGNDTLSGGNGDDLILGGNGNDFIFGGNGNDRLRGEAGIDVIRGALGRDFLHGGSQADQLYGQGGADTLIGGGGADTLSGGAGADTFVFRDVDHGGDVIIDFRVNDFLDFSAIFTNPGYTRTGTFAYLRRVQSGADTVIRVDSNGDQSGGFVDYVTLLNTAVTDVTARNFVV